MYFVLLKQLRAAPRLQSGSVMETASDNPKTRDTDEVDGSSGLSIEGKAALEGLMAAAGEKIEKEQAARDRRKRVEEETARCEKVLKDTRTGKQGRHK